MQKQLSFLNKVYVPTPVNISYYWNVGSLMLFMMVIQMMSGVLLTMQYSSGIEKVFEMVDGMVRESNNGQYVRYAHMMGVSLLFMFLYIHLGRNLYYSLYSDIRMWFSGCSLLMLSMGAGFLGYVLPWGQMSYWGATVMTNFISVIPIIGVSLLEWVWGGFSVGGPTLMRFFSLHYLIPLVILLLMGVHLILLHDKGSTNPLGLLSVSHKIKFYPYFMIKDMLGILLIIGILLLLLSSHLGWLMECQNAMEAKVLVTPPHMQPEWYYLAVYAILRGMPKKLGGVMSLVLFLLVIIFIPFITYKNSYKIQWNSSVYWSIWFMNFLFLTWLGSCLVESPYLELVWFSGVIYFSIIFLNKKK